MSSTAVTGAGASPTPYSPYNPRNRAIGVREVAGILRNYGVPDRVRNLELYKRAFVHGSYVRAEAEAFAAGCDAHEGLAPCPEGCIDLRSKSNERLEFLGDGVLECITKCYLYRRFPKANEGFMTEKKMDIVKNESIGRIAYEMGLYKWYLLSADAEAKKFRTNHKRLGCLFESFLGALFLDFSDHGKDMARGYSVCAAYIEAIFDRHINWTALITSDDNYKKQLQVMVQQTFGITPTYLQLRRTEEEGFTVGVYVALNVPVEDVRHEKSVALRAVLDSREGREIRRRVPEAASAKTDAAAAFRLLREYSEAHDGRLFVCLGTESHMIKKKAEQECCRKVLGL